MSRTPKAARSLVPSALRLSALGLCAVLPFATEATAQTRPLTLSISSDQSSYKTELSMASNPFLFVRCTTDPSMSAGWYGAVTNAYFETNILNVQPDLPAITQPLSSFVENPLFGFPSGANVPTSWTINLDAAGGNDFFSRAFLSGGSASEDAVKQFLDPLHNPPTLQPQIVQQFGSNTGFGWMVDADSGAFNADALLQQAAWRRLQPLLPAGTRESEFFNDQWQGYLFNGIELAVTLISVRGGNVTAAQGVAPGAGGTPGLLGFPTTVPTLGISNEARLKFGGTGENPNFALEYDPALGLQKIYPATAGGGVAMPGSGFRPKMQIRLCESQTTGVDYIIPLRWAGFGITAFRVPVAAALGPHSVREYRYHRGTVAGVPVYGPWKTIPVGSRPLVLVQ